MMGRLKGREHPLYSSNALIYDAVQVLSKALNDLASMEVMMVDVKYSHLMDMLAGHAASAS